jgi:mRNA interferase RelE/StbE
MPRNDLDYLIVFTRTAAKELERIESTIALKILEKIEDLSKSPRPAGCKKLAGSNDIWRIRIGNYRVIYSISDRERLIDINLIRHRSKAYKDL